MNKSDIKHNFVIFVLFLIILSAAVIPASADTSVAWTHDIGDVTAADMSEDGSVIYAAVQLSSASSEVYQYDAAGVEQNVFGGISGVVTHLVCTQSGSQAAIATDANIVYYIDSGALTWQRSFSSAITDLDISEVGNVLVVESPVFHKLLRDGSTEYDSASGTYSGGVIDPDDEFAIVGSSGNVLQKYILSTTDQYWGKTNNNTFNTAFQDYQNVLILYTNTNQTDAIILSNETLGNELWDQINSTIAISDSNLSITNAYRYMDCIKDWTQATAAAGWSARTYACAWVYDNKMWIGGGFQGSTYYHDVWYSTDGITWTQATAAAGWSARTSACAWVYDNKMWIGGGLQGSTHYHDVWASMDALIIQPSTTGDTWVFYNYTGASPQHTQTTYADAIDFSGTYSLQTKPTLSIYDLQTTKTLNGNIQAISLSDRGDWLGTATTTRIYHDQITSGGFGTEYYAALGSTGTVYDIATANSAAMSVVGQGQITDIYSMSASRVGTYTAGGAVQHVDIADKNALWAASGGEDGKVYVFSKDASSNWYLEFSSDSENPITALRMSARGEYVLAGRTNSLTLYQTNTPEITNTDFWFTLYAYKDSDSYRNAAINVSVYSGNQWNSFAQGLTDSAGKYVVQLTAGQTYKFDVGNGEKAVIVMASPSVQSQTVNIHTSPISEAISYKAVWNEEINGIDLKYNDNSGQTNSVTVKVQRTDTWETVYEQTFTNTQNIDEQLPIVDDTTSYKVQFSANRVSGTSRNSFVLSSSRDIIPIPLDQNIKNVLFSCFLIVLAGLFSYMSAIRGALVVAFSATLFVYLGWLTIPWHWLIIAIVIAIVAGFTQRRG